MKSFGKCLDSVGAIFEKWMEDFGEFSGRWSGRYSVVTRVFSEVSLFFLFFFGKLKVEYKQFWSRF